MGSRDCLKFLCAFVILGVASTEWASAAESVLSVDKSLIIQIVIFVASIFILNNLLFRPLLNIVEKRERLTVGAIEEAKRLEAEVERIIGEYNRRLNEARAQAMEERNEMRRQAQRAAEELVERAKREAQILIEEAKSKLEGEMGVIKERIKPEIEVLAKELALQILGKKEL
jgi:F-type H+-transporting ATPase subunit b